MGHEAPVCVSSINTGMPTNLLKEHRVQSIGRLLDLRDPTFEPQVAHASTLKALGLEELRPAGDSAVTTEQCPASLGSEVQGQDRCTTDWVSAASSIARQAST
jgi:hypothetical protein